ncbi:hypothetical protein BVY02_00895 [bacterium J17]|nr:hypothetical protein BVY02_00895 [bacterium J17]
MEFMLITVVPEIALEVEAAGVSRIFVDMETMGKPQRQANANTPIYSHSFEDVSSLKKTLKKAEVMLRINPLHSGTQEEIDRAIDAGADCIMFPYFTSENEVQEFIRLVDSRVRTNILFETSQAVGRANQIFRVGGFDEVHFGLNDLRLTLGLDFLFESVAGGLIDWLCSLAQSAGVSYGFGGVGRVGKEMLSAELILKEHIRLGSERVILSRVFHGEAKNLGELREYVDLKEEVEKVREVIRLAKDRSPDEIESDSLEFQAAVRKIAQMISEKARGERKVGNL